MKIRKISFVLSILASTAFGDAAASAGRRKLTDIQPENIVSLADAKRAFYGADAAASSSEGSNPSSKSKISSNLYNLADEVSRRGSLRRALSELNLDDSVIVDGDGNVLCEVIGTDSSQFMDALDQAGCVYNPDTATQNLCTARCPIDSLVANADAFESESAIRGVREVMASRNQVGSILGEGSQALFADDVKANYGIDGSGVTLGILSDSFDTSGGPVSYADDIATGDLPDDVIILEDPLAGIDEGRAMAQLVHDIAPGATLAFHSAFLGQEDFADGIRELRDVAGCDIIVDDIIYFAEPMYSDGIISLAATEVADAGSSYFSSAGNQRRSSWEGSYSGIPNVGIGLGSFMDSVACGVSPCYPELQDFDGQGTFLQEIPYPDGFRTTLLILQWDEPFISQGQLNGAESDFDIFLFFTLSDSGCSFFGLGPGCLIYLGSLLSANAGGDPVEGFQVTFDPFYDVIEVQTMAMAFPKFSGPATTPLMKWVEFSARPSETFPPNGFGVGSSYGHANGENVAGVGASRFDLTPGFGVSPAVLESFSSAGGVPINRAPDGTPLGSPIVRERPNFVGPDGILNTFFFGSTPGRFFGTSASAPNVAAVAALMLEAKSSLTPPEIYGILESTADDMFGPGFDFDSGYGYVNASAAMELVCPVSITCDFVGHGPSSRNLFGQPAGDEQDAATDETAHLLLRGGDETADSHRQLMEVYSLDYAVESNCDLDLTIVRQEVSVCGGSKRLEVLPGDMVRYQNDNRCVVRRLPAANGNDDILVMGTDVQLTVTAAFVPGSELSYTCTATVPDIVNGNPQGPP